MPRTNSLASVEIDVGEEREELPRPDPETPFHILLAGDFTGHATHHPRPILIDRDNFEDVLARLAPQLNLTLGQAALPLTFRDLDDFHPDSLFERLELFRRMRDLRRRLSDRATFAAAAAEISAPPASRPAPEVANLSGADLLRQMMGEAPVPRTAPAESDWDRMLRELVAPFAEPGPDPQQPELIAQVDAAVTGQMRALLHHPRFQALEAAWRGVFFLVRRLETDESLKISLLDISQAEFAGGSGLESLRRAVTGYAGGPTPFAVVAGLYSFGPRDEALLRSLAAIAHAANAPLLAECSPDVLALPDAFGALRHSPDARWVGLAMPRFLLRLPYGADTDSVERFAFEEMPALPEHQRYLWCNPSVACATLLGEAFSRHGWDLRPGAVLDIEGLPLHLYRKDGDAVVKPCAELLLTMKEVEAILDRGVMPLISFRDTDRVRLARFQSMSEPSAPLAGKWS
ncbi:MAG TPA: type VI secretion system contractile sheath large subunit [Bryobacteraceae bacterium]|nr:type VI secretion system contractile sheath large subunit [Bryobacteraceae bacterium]